MVFFKRKKVTPLKKIEDVYSVSLLFARKEKLPDDEMIVEQLETLYQKAKSENENEKENEYRIFGVLDYAQDVEGVKKVPAHLAMEKEYRVFQIEEKEKGEMKQQPDCEEAEEILEKAKYELVVSDFLSIDLTPKQRGDLITNWVKLLVFMCHDCIGIYNHMSKKILSRSQILPLFAKSNTYGFLQMGIKLRIFPIQGTNEMVLDTLGLYGIDLPDVQYHLKKMDPTNLLEHAMNMAVFLYENKIELKQGDIITGISNQDAWVCRYEKAIAPPRRRVLDIQTGKYAARRRVRKER